MDSLLTYIYIYKWRTVVEIIWNVKNSNDIIVTHVYLSV